MRKQTKKILICSTILFCSAPIYAHAGLPDVFSVFEAILPLAVLWTFFVPSWYLAISVVATRRGAAVGGVPPLPKAAWILAWIGILSVLMIGPMGIIYLLLFFPPVTLQAFRNPKKTKISAHLAIALQRISIVSILLLAGLIAGSIYIHKQRTKADFQRLLAPSQTARHSIFNQVTRRSFTSSIQSSERVN